MNVGAHTLDLSRPVVMGVLNVTPDSFSDGGQFLAAESAIAHAGQMVRAGAAIIDIGGESTRPGAEPVTAAEELKRILPVIKAVKETQVPISIDTSKPEVMHEAVAAGAAFINDVRALQAPGAAETAASLNVPVCLMHMQGEPRTMQVNPHYDDVARDIHVFFEERIEALLAAGVREDHIVLDPGFGFGKTLDHNLELLRRLSEFLDLGRPVLVGLSRKSMFGKLLDNAPADQRLSGSLAAAVIAAWQGAAIIRAHDVKPTVDALRVTAATQRAGLRA